MLHIYMWRQQNETQNTVWKREKGEWKYNGGVNLFKLHWMHVWNYHKSS
jgi:hypothetical protein